MKKGTVKTEIPALKDKNGRYIKEADLVEHNGKLYIVKWSDNLKEWVLRIKNDTGMNWRDMNWFERCGKYCEIKISGIN